MPCPLIADNSLPRDNITYKNVLEAFKNNNFDKAYEYLISDLDSPPFSTAIYDSIITAVKHIIKIEMERGSISRSDRSRLQSDSQNYQDFIDRVLFSMAGLSVEEVGNLENRLIQML